jgi:hypothetical protein
MKTHGGAPPLLTSAMDGSAWSASRPYHVTTGETAPWYLLHRRLGGTQSRSGRYGEKKNSCPLPRTEPRLLGRPASSVLSIQTELTQIVKITLYGAMISPLDSGSWNLVEFLWNNSRSASQEFLASDRTRRLITVFIEAIGLYPPSNTLQKL